METVSDRVVVAFSGDGSGTEDLAWGQQDIWMSARRLGSWMPLGGVQPLPPGTTVEDMAGQLGYMLGRYQVLRTKLLLDDLDRPRQVVHADGVAALEVVDAGDTDPAVVAAEVHRRYTDTMLDFAAEWPIRMGVVRRHGHVTHLVLVLSHLATDALGARVMLREVATRDATPVTGMQSLDQARWQRSPSGQRQNQSALRHYESILRTIAPRRFPQSRDVRPQPVWSGDFTSPAMRLAVAAVADRTKLDAATVLLAAFAVALTRVTGVNPVVVRPFVGNRFRRGLADVVSTVAQSGLCALDVADVPFGEALVRVKHAMMTVYKHAYHDPADFAALLDRVSRERGTDVDVACFFNNRRAEDAPPPTSEVTPDVLAEALPRSVLRWTPTDKTPMRRTFTRVEPDTADALRLTMLIDTNLLSPADAEACLRGMETVTVEAACAVDARL